MSELTGWRCPNCGAHNHMLNDSCANERCDFSKPSPLTTADRIEILTQLGGARGSRRPRPRGVQDMAIARYEALVRELSYQLLNLAKLAAPTPQFDNPIKAWDAERLRDRILALANGEVPV